MPTKLTLNLDNGSDENKNENKNNNDSKEQNRESVSTTPPTQLFEHDVVYTNFPTADGMRNENAAAAEIALRKAEMQARDKGLSDEQIQEKLIEVARARVRMARAADNITTTFLQKGITFPPIGLDEYDNNSLPERIKNSPAYSILSKNFIEISKNWLDANVTEVKLSFKESPEGDLAITIQDNGKGFPQKFIPEGSTESRSYREILGEEDVTKIKSGKASTGLEHTLTSLGEAKDLNDIIAKTRDIISTIPFGGAGRGLAGMYRNVRASGDLEIANAMDVSGRVLGAVITISSLITPALAEKNLLTLSSDTAISITPFPTETSDEEIDESVSMLANFKFKKLDMTPDTSDSESSEENLPSISMDDEISEIKILTNETNAVEFTQQQRSPITLARTGSIEELTQENVNATSIKKLYIEKEGSALEQQSDNKISFKLK